MIQEDSLRSAADQFGPLRRFVAADALIAQWARGGSRFRLFAYEFLRFGFKQAVACVFAGLMVGLLIATHYVYPRGAVLSRYDFLFLSAVVIQIVLIWSKFESLDEAKVIFLYHVAGTIMEVFKTAHGSWLYRSPLFSALAACRCSPASCMRRSAPT